MTRTTEPTLKHTTEELRDMQQQIERHHKFVDLRPRSNQADGEPDCRCKGAGGGGTQRWTQAADPLGSIPTWEWYCDCATGEWLEDLTRRYRKDLYALIDQRQLERLWKKSAVPAHFANLTVDSYPTTRETKEVIDWLWGAGDDTPSWLDTDNWLLLWGGFGTGKTGLAISLMRELGARAVGSKETGGVLFITVTDLLDRLRMSYGSANGLGETEKDLMESARNVPLLVLDDIGAERSTDWAVERLFALLDYRHNHRKRTIITSNLSPDELAAHLGERTFWRILEMCKTDDDRDQRWEPTGTAYLVQLVGPNLRKPQAQKPQLREAA